MQEEPGEALTVRVVRMAYPDTTSWWKRVTCMHVVGLVMCLCAGMAGGLVGSMMAPSSRQSTDSDARLSSDGMVSMDQMAESFEVFRSNISSFVSSRINLIQNTVNHVSKIVNVQKSSQTSNFQLFSFNDTTLSIGFGVLMVVVITVSLPLTTMVAVSLYSY